jgi:hypothetical protein
VTRSDWLSLLVLAPVAWTFVVQPHGRVARAEAGRTTAVAVGATVTAPAALSAPADVPRPGLPDESSTGNRLTTAGGAVAPLDDAGWRSPEPWRRLRDGAAGTYIDDVLAGHGAALARWPDRSRRPLTIWVQPEPALWDFDPAYGEHVRDAFRAWESTGIPVRFAFTRDSARAEVHVTWTDRFDEPISGKTIWSRDDDWWIVDASIVLAVRHSAGDPLDASAVHAIALHEVGHLIGLDHTRDPATIMTSRVRVRGLTDADRATARLVYSLPPGRVRVR